MKINRPPLILVADDEVNTTAMLQYIFEREGYQVKQVNRGDTALAMAREILPDLILLDILMPGMNGFEVLEALRQDPLTASTPCILITANVKEPADIARGLNLGADDYIQKPFAPKELVARAQSKIKARQLEDALQKRTRQLESLLRISEFLNQHLQVAEIVEMIPALALDLLPCEMSILYLLDPSGEPIDSRASYSASASEGSPDGSFLIAQESAFRDIILPQTLVSRSHLNAWRDIKLDSRTDATPFHVVSLLLQQSNDRLALLIMARRQEAFDEDEQRLFEGIGRQGALALHNAHLYTLQANYAQNLEQRVKERTATLEAAQKMLLRSEKLASIGHLAASIAHEINNPLMPIRNLLDDMVDELREQGFAFDERAVQIIGESLERIRVIVSRLLQFTRDGGPNLQSLDINALLDGVVQLNQKFFNNEGIQITTAFSDVSSLYGNKDQLEQVFMNLALNAQAAMPDGGSLTIRTFQRDQQVIISFTDTGTGIASKHLEKIFDPFYSTKPNGTGLGLFISHGIIEGHNGTIEVSTHLGKGTQFVVTLPIEPKIQ